jgi:mannose-6-phosphate isomerase-like protein (cupin superfamily)
LTTERKQDTVSTASTEQRRTNMAEGFVNPRRIVTVIGADGVSRVARIDEVQEVDYAAAFPGASPERMGPSGEMRVWRLWGHDQLPFPLPTDGLSPAIEGDPSPEQADEALRASTLPPPLGMRVTMVTFAPSEQLGPMGGHDTVDVIWVIRGRLKQVMEGGDHVILEPGDCIIQCGTARAYQNIGDGPATIGAVVMGAERIGSPRPSGTGSHAAAAR